MHTTADELCLSMSSEKKTTIIRIRDPADGDGICIQTHAHMLAVCVRAGRDFLVICCGPPVCCPFAFQRCSYILFSAGEL